MTLAFERGKESYIICMAEDIPYLLSYFEDVALVWEMKNVSILSVPGVDLHLEHLSLDGLSIMRYLDSFFVVLPINDDSAKALLYDALFSAISSIYEQIIDCSRNLENIRNLLFFMQRFLLSLKGLKILDFGCGTGLSFCLCAELNASVIGVDRSLEMLKIARCKGMKVLTVRELEDEEDGSFDGAFASYVFHLLVDFEALNLLWNKLRPGAPLIGNFHKNRGMDSVIALISSKGGAVVNLDRSEKHGKYVAFIKG